MARISMQLGLTLLLLANCAAFAGSAGAIPSADDMAAIRQEVESLRGKAFQRDVPARTISEADLRAIVDRELAKEYPGGKLDALRDLMVWLDFLPPETDLAAVCADLMVDQVAGLYDSDTKTMCLPSLEPTNQPSATQRKTPSRKTLEELPGPEVGLVFTHEYTHALEDQYWPIDDATNKNAAVSTDRETAQSFLMEGSATRLMIEAMPAEAERSHAGSYVFLWTLIHSGTGEAFLNLALSQVWKSRDVKVAGVPETLSRSLAMPYSYGYVFCRKTMRDWGLDGLDYIYDHPPVSTEQIMHPEKCWEWRDFPVLITLPEALPGGWKRLIDETLGEADTAVLLGCQLKNLNRGENLASGWDGDRVALYEASDGRRLMAWASAWDSPLAADRFARAWVKERKLLHKAVLTKRPGRLFAWKCPNGRVGEIRRMGKQVLVFESSDPAALDQGDAWPKTITFTEPPEDAARAASNPVWLRSNPLLSRSVDGDYVVTKSLAGLLWRHDHNSIGSADTAALGLVGEWRHTTSYHRWRLGWGLAAKHESEARRATTKTTLLPWGLLCSHFSTALPQAPTHTLTRDTLLWGLVATSKTDARDKHTFCLLPAGLLLKTTTAPNETSCHILATGYSRRGAGTDAGSTTRLRFLGVPVWSWH